MIKRDTFIVAMNLITEHNAQLRRMMDLANTIGANLLLISTESFYHDAISLVFKESLLNERERLSYAIRTAKQGMTIDFDGEVSLNVKRQEIANIFRHMGEIRCSENLYLGAGVGYKFNAEGNQVSYRCDLKKITTINFDRNKVRAFAAALNKKADEVSAELDKRMVNTEVGYEAPFDVNDSFAEVLQWHIDRNS